MIQTKQRITVCLEKPQVKALKNVSKIMKCSVSELVRDLVGETILNFEVLATNRDISGARKRTEELYSQSLAILDEVARHDSNN